MPSAAPLLTGSTTLAALVTLPAGMLTLMPKNVLLATVLPYTTMPKPGSGMAMMPLQVVAAPLLVVQALAARLRKPLRGLLLLKLSTRPSDLRLRV